MKSRSLMLWKLLFLVWGLAVGLLPAFPAEIGLGADNDSLPAERQTNERIGQLPPEPEELVLAPDIILMPPPELAIDDDAIANEVEPEQTKFEAISLELLVEKSPQPSTKPEIQKEVVLSNHAKAFATELKRKNLLEPADPVGSVAEEAELVAAEGFSERKLSAALVYLRDYQTDDGVWEADSWWPEVREGAFSYDCETRHETEFGYESDAVANTSLALLAFVSAGYDHTMGPFKSTCRRAIIYLQRNQAQDGMISSKIKHHSLAVTALSEVYALSGQAILKPSANYALNYLLRQQHADGGFGDNGESNVIDTCYAVMAIKSARMSGLEVDKKASEKAFAYIESMRDGDHVRYSAIREFPEQAGNATEANFPTCEAAWILSALLPNNLNIRDKTVRSMADRLVEKQNLPDWKANNIDCEYYWLASQALFQADGGYVKKGTHWATWTEAFSAQLLEHQRGFTEYDKDSDLCSAKQLLEHGSWDPAGVNGPRYGRVYTTSMCFLSLERVCGYHYMKIGPRPEDEPTEDEEIVDFPSTEDHSDVPNEDLAPNPNSDDCDGGPSPLPSRR